MFGAALGPLAGAILRAAPPGTCGMCLAPVEGWEFECTACGADVRDRPLLADGATAAGSLPADVAPELEELARAARAANAAHHGPLPAAAAAPTVAPTAVPEAGPARGPARRPGRMTRTARQAPGAGGSPELARAIFVEGSEPMVPGALYSLRFHRDDLRLTGPVDVRPDHIVVSRRLRELAITALGDRLIITGASRKLDDFYLVLAAPPDRSAQVIARELDDARLAASESRAAS